MKVQEYVRTHPGRRKAYFVIRNFKYGSLLLVFVSKHGKQHVGFAQ
jgi:hypothetical protein